uniref:protein-serine/threonine phosphatase n=1 Tax=Romanomermis culicivorax TaxID=13658 RepID=A0A915K879_ROMCU
MYKGTPALIEIEAPVTIGGDTHGDYVDRGPFSCDIQTTSTYCAECEVRFTNLLWYHFQTAFDSLPVAGLVSNRIFCMHGGLSPDLHCFSQLRRMLLPFEVPDTGGLVCDLLWSDPCAGIKATLMNLIFRVRCEHQRRQCDFPSDSYKFGDDVVSNFCAKHTVDLIARAHQVVCDGVEFFADQKLITIFSAPAYCGQFDNTAGLLAVNANLACKVLVSHELLISPTILELVLEIKLSQEPSDQHFLRPDVLETKGHPVLLAFVDIGHLRVMVVFDGTVRHVLCVSRRPINFIPVPSPSSLYASTNKL